MPKNFPPTCTLCASHATWSPATSSLPFANYAGSASGLYQSKTAATSGCALHIILCTDACRHISQMHTRTHRDRDACLDGCTHNEVDSYIIEVDEILLKDDCENEFHLRLQS